MVKLEPILKQVSIEKHLPPQGSKCCLLLANWFLRC